MINYDRLYNLEIQTYNKLSLWLTKLIYTKIWHLEILENIFLITKNNKVAIQMPPLTYYFGLTFGSKNKECEEKNALK